MIEIDGKMYKEISRDNFSAYFIKCKELGINPIPKTTKIDGKVVVVYEDIDNYKVIPKEVVKEIKDVSSLLSDKKLNIKELVGDKKLIDFPFVYTTGSNNYQYCDNCGRETNHIVNNTIIVCCNCKKGYKIS